MAESKKVRLHIEDYFYDGNPKKAFSLIPDPVGGWRIKPLQLYQEIPVRVVRIQADGKREVILQVGASTSNLYDENNPPLLQEADEITVGMVNQFVVTRTPDGQWELKPKDPELEMQVKQ